MKLTRLILILVLFCYVSIFSQNSLKIGFLADKEYSQLTKEEKSAFEWLKSAYPNSSVVLFDAIAKGGNLSKFDLLWWHYDENIKLPESSLNQAVIKEISGFAGKGKGVLLTLLASQYVADLKIESILPNKIFKGGWEIKDTYKEIKGYHSFAGHPIFNSLFDGVYTWNTKRDYPYTAAYYDGILPANGKVVGIGWDYITFNENERHIIEYNFAKGKCITIGSYLYFADEKNVYRKHLEKLLANSFEYLMSKNNAAKKTYWAFDPLDFEIKKGVNPSSANVNKYRKIDFTKTSGLEINAEADNKNYIEVSGLRALMMGKENGGLDEVWVHPARAFRNYSVAVINSREESELNKLTPAITVRPESFTRNYQLNKDKITEVLFAARELPSGVINYKFNLLEPCKVKIAFDVDNRVMWPFEENYPGKYEVAGNNPVVISSKDNSICSLFGIDSGAETLVKVLDSKEKTKYVRIEFTLDLKKGENSFNFIFASSNEGRKKTNDYFRRTFDNISTLYSEHVKYYTELFKNKTVIETPDKEFNDAYKWALAGVDKFFVYTYPLGVSFMAGMGTTERGWDGAQKINGRPGYAWYFGRDSEWTSFAVLDYGDFSKVKSVLEFLGRYQDLTGKIFHELTSSNAVHYDAADATPLYVILMGKYLNATGDIAFIKKEWSRIKKAMDFCYSTDTDKDGLIENTNVGHGWVEGGKIYGAHVTFYLAGLWASTLEHGSKIASALDKNDLATLYEKDAEKVKKVIDTDFWNEKDKFYYDGKNIDGSFAPSKTIQVTVPMYFNSTDPVKSASGIREFFGNDFTTNWGARIIGESNPMFNPKGYHYGTVWPLFTGWVALAEYKYGFSLQGFQQVMSNLMIYKNWGRGYIEEVLNGIEYKPAGVCSHQAWSESMALQPLLEGMIGIYPDKMKNELTISTQIPAHFNQLNVKQICFGKTKIDLTYSTDYNKTEFLFKTENPSREKIILRPRILPGASVVQVLLNGKPVPYRINDGFIEAGFVLLPECKVVVETKGGIALKPVINNPQVGDKPYGTRIIDEKMNGNSYQIMLEGVPEKEEKLTLFTDRFIKKITGANLITDSGITKIIEVKFPKTDKNYGFCKVELVF